MEIKKFELGKLKLLELFPTEKIRNPEGFSKKYSFIKKAKYLCFCGNEFIALTNNVNRGNTKSCGCYYKHTRGLVGKTHGETKYRLYEIWSRIKSRCDNLNSSDYSYYGGRGITVCDEWSNSYEVFRDWALENGYEDRLEIDRIDNDKGYSPDNCRWVDRSIQVINQGIRSDNISGCSGVTFKKENSLKPWLAKINIKKKEVYLGYFSTKQEACEAYQKAKKERDEMYLKEFEERKNKIK